MTEFSKEIYERYIEDLIKAHVLGLRTPLDTFLHTNTLEILEEMQREGYLIIAGSLKFWIPWPIAPHIPNDYTITEKGLSLINWKGLKVSLGQFCDKDTLKSTEIYFRVKTYIIERIYSYSPQVSQFYCVPEIYNSDTIENISHQLQVIFQEYSFRQIGLALGDFD